MKKPAKKSSVNLRAIERDLKKQHEAKLSTREFRALEEKQLNIDELYLMGRQICQGSHGALLFKVVACPSPKNKVPRLMVYTPEGEPAMGMLVEKFPGGTVIDDQENLPTLSGMGDWNEKTVRGALLEHFLYLKESENTEITSMLSSGDEVLRAAKLIPPRKNTPETSKISLWQQYPELHISTLSKQDPLRDLSYSGPRRPDLETWFLHSIGILLLRMLTLCLIISILRECIPSSIWASKQEFTDSSNLAMLCSLIATPVIYGLLTLYGKAKWHQQILRNAAILKGHTEEEPPMILQGKI